MAPDVFVSRVVSSSQDQHNGWERPLPLRQAQDNGDLVVGGEIGEVDFPLHIQCWPCVNGVFLRPLANGRGHVCRGPAFQDQRIDLLKRQIAIPELVLVIPDAVVAQIELVTAKCKCVPSDVI